MHDIGIVVVWRGAVGSRTGLAQGETVVAQSRCGSCASATPPGLLAPPSASAATAATATTTTTTTARASPSPSPSHSRYSPHSRRTAGRRAAQTATRARAASSSISGACPTPWTCMPSLQTSVGQRHPCLSATPSDSGSGISPSRSCVRRTAEGRGGMRKHLVLGANAGIDTCKGAHNSMHSHTTRQRHLPTPTSPACAIRSHQRQHRIDVQQHCFGRGASAMGDSSTASPMSSSSTANANAKKPLSPMRDPTALRPNHD